MEKKNQNKNNKSSRRNIQIWQKIVSVFFVFALMINTMFSGGLVGLFESSDGLTVEAEDVIAYTPTNPATAFTESPYSFSNDPTGKTKFVDYCYHYSVNTNGTFCSTHKDDIITLTFNELESSYQFMGLGNASVPFAGSVRFISTSGTSNISLSRALFSHVSTDAKVADASGNPITLEITRNSTTSSPLLADHVYPGTGDASWKVKVPSSNTNSFAGVIGQLEADTAVTLVFENASTAAVSNTATGSNDIKDVGELCGIMKTGSSLTVTDNSSARTAVSSTNGNAGSLVGSMEGTASLTLSKCPVFTAVSVTSESGYAGGLVGKSSTSATITGLTAPMATGLTSPLAVGGTVTGSMGAGGLYGYYANTASEFDLKDYYITASVSADNCGGVFGVLESTKGSNTSVSLTIMNTGNAGRVNVSSGSSATSGYFGGIAGKYTTDDLKNTLFLDSLSISAASNAAFDSFGGAIGIADSAAYIKADGLSVTASGTAKKDSSSYYGGLIGKTSDTYGVFVDLSDFSVSVDSAGYKGGGIVGDFENGVLRLSGITDMSTAKSQKGGQLVGVNNNVLVYALGTGTDGVSSVRNNTTKEITTAASGWTFKRSDSSQVDDLGTWGEVVRIANIEDATNGILTLDSTNHTVTVKAAETSMGTSKAFAKTALNIQLNQGTGYNCLLFITGDANTRSSLLGTTLTLTDSISLAGTGITGFMRDGSDSIGTFTGTLNGDSKAITLAVGEKYGKTSADAAITSSTTGEGLGQIYRHPYNGLFASIGNGTTAGTVNSLTISGEITVRNKIDGMNVGGIAAVSQGSTTLNGITANQTINFGEPTSVGGNEAKGKNIGGLIGLANGADNGIIAITGTNTISTTYNISDNFKSWNALGAFIGKVTSPKFTINIAQGDADTLTVSHKMVDANTFSAGGNTDGGGLIGYITAGTFANRKVNINHLEFDDCTIINKASNNAGGFLGYAWLDTDTTIDGLTVTDGTITNSSKNVGVMCYIATGHWKVNNLIITKMSLSGGAGTSLGMLVNMAYNGDNGLYLDVLKNGYTLTDKTSTSGITLPGTLGVYDELAAYSASNVIQGGNGAGVISINMNTSRTETKTKIRDYTASTATEDGTGTYQNQLTSESSASLANAAKYPNANSRYYYNLDAMSKSDAEQNIMLWSVNKYAANNIKYSTSNMNGFFDFNANPFSFDSETTVSLSNYSYYPVYSVSDMTLKNINLNFGYSGIYAVEGNSTLNTDSYNRDPSAQNQHYLMQSGLFINGTEGSTLTLDTVKLSGDFLENSTYQGILFSGTTNGSISIDGLVLEGITPKYNNSGTISNYNTGYLLVKNVTREDSFKENIHINLQDISTTNDYTASSTTATVSKSLFGDVYGPVININVSDVKLDARSSSSALTGTDKTNLDNEYGTVNSIFTTATLFNSLKTSQTATMIYNYTSTDDWTDGRNVTYGKEVSESLEYADKENKYYNESIYTDPTSNSHTAEPGYDFSTNWLPYVATPYTADQTKDANGCFNRELKVNVPSTDYAEGCGTYNDPYIIDSGEKLMAIAALINDASQTTELPSIQLPKTLYNGIAANTTGARWCEGKADHAVYTIVGDNYVSSAEGVTAVWSIENVRLYLANAYYSIEASNIVLDSGYLGLGGTADTTDNTGKFAFRGVIVGNSNTIVNNSASPFINVSNGCVIKDLIVNQNVNVNLTEQNTADSTNAYFGYNSACNYYGGMIGEIMGGDNIIDNSYVNFGSTTVTLTGSKGTIVPVGGYVGVIVYGGLIFKNIDARKTTLAQTHLNVVYDGSMGTTTSGINLASETKEVDRNTVKNQEAWAAIYVNPLVGRVINGYAVNETGGTAKDSTGALVKQFSVTEDEHYHDDDNNTRTGVSHTLQNGKKHYSIADLNPELAKLDVKSITTSESVDGNIDVPNAQALFVLSLITQSGAGTAQTLNDPNGSGTHTTNTVVTSDVTDESGNRTIHQTTTITDIDDSMSSYPYSLSYGTYDGHVYGMSHTATYEDIGESSSSDYTTYVGNDTAANTALPYIIRHFTVGGLKNTSSSVEGDPVVVPYTAPGSVDLYEGSDLDGKEFYIYGKGRQSQNCYLNAKQFYDDKRGVIGPGAVQVSDYNDLPTSNATKMLFTKVGTTGNYYSISFFDGGTEKYLAFNGVGRNIIVSTTPYSFTVVKENEKWNIGHTTAVSNYNYLNIRNENQFVGQADGGLLLYIETPGPTTTTTTITTTVTNTNSVIYPARCITSTVGYYNINLSTGVSYQLPDSFRGLGCVGIYDTNANKSAKYGMKINSFDGKGCTIDQDIYLNKFETDNYFNVLHAGTTQDLSSDSQDYIGNRSAGTNDNHGIGLFDNVITKDSSSQIKDFFLSGSVNTEIFNNTYATSNQELALITTGRGLKSMWLSVGGVCGWSGNGIELAFNKIRLNNLTVNGADFVGGLLGFSGTSSITVLVTVRECSATNISIKMSSANAVNWATNEDNSARARNGMGCFVGKVLEGGVRIFGTANTTETILNDDLTKFSTVTIKDFGFADDSLEYYTTAGGLVGYAGNGCKVYDMKVMPAEGKTITIGSDKTRYAGGLVGLMQPKDKGGNTCETVFYNCTVQEINVKGHYAGGFYGGKWINEWSPYSIKIDKCNVVGNASSNNTITGNNMAKDGYAGGFLGCGNVYTDGTPNIEISDCKVSNYTITSNASSAYVGGFIGYTGAQDDNKSITCYIHDSSVEDCTIGAGNNYGGGAIGRVVRLSERSKNKILGYNIKLDTVIIGSSFKGAWIGWVDTNDNTTSIQFTGVGIYGNGYDQNVGNRANFSNASFVFSDYGEACASYDATNNPISSLNCSDHSSSSTTHVEMPKYPYVNVNPQSSMGTGEIISGDGAVLGSTASATTAYSTKTAEQTMALKIFEDTYTSDTSAANYSRRYTTFKTYNDTDVAKINDGYKIDHYMERSVDDDGDRISNYYDEKGYTTAQAYENFACIVIANNTPQETTDLINRYAQLVTNTSKVYSEEDASDEYFDIVVSPCKLSGGKFVIDTAEGATSGLNYSGGQFSLNGSGADSLKPVDSFTLVDIQFKDPLYTNKVAYHLYIPVYTIKEIEITFSAAVMNGANSVSYDSGTESVNPYSEKLSKTTLDMHADNLNTWYTTYVRYTYDSDDIQALLDSGNLNWSHNKYFYIDKTGHTATSMLPENTYMILVDPNGDHDKKYQVLLNETDFARTNVTVTTGASTNTTSRITFDLTKFKDSSDTTFGVSTFNELVAKRITATPVAGTGKYNAYSGVTPSNTGETRYVYTESQNGRQTYYQYVGSGGNYDLSLGDDDIYENYYISFYVPGAANDASLYGYYIRTPESFDAPSYAPGTNNAIPKSAKVNCVYATDYSGSSTGNRQVYIGNIFNQDTELTVRPNDPEIDADNKTLNIYAKTTITPKDPNVIAFLQSVDADIYHSFNLFLDRKGEDGKVINEIYGIDNNGIEIKAWYSIGEPIPEGDTADMTSFNSIDYVTGINRQSSYINVRTVNGGQTLLNSSGVTVYSRIRLDFHDITEFPQKVATDTGVSVRAASNLAYDTSSLAFSSMSEPMNELEATKHIYYRQSYDSATLNYYAKTELDSYDEDGAPSENYSRLGVSGLYSMNEYMPVDTTAQYNTQNIENAIKDADQLSLTISLQKKTDLPVEGPYTSAIYQNVSGIKDYWGAVERSATTNEVSPSSSTGKPVTVANTTNLRIKCGTYDEIVTVTGSSESFTLTIPKAASGTPGYTVDESGYIYVDIGFNAKTGEGFTEYANYKVNLAVKLRDTVKNEDIVGSHADSYLIYTNAKVNHEFLKEN